MSDEQKSKHGYRSWKTRHGLTSTRKGKADRKRVRRAAAAPVRGKFKKLYPEVPPHPPPAPPPLPPEKEEE